MFLILIIQIRNIINIYVCFNYLEISLVIIIDKEAVKKINYLILYSFLSLYKLILGWLNNLKPMLELPIPPEINNLVLFIS